MPVLSASSIVRRIMYGGRSEEARYFDDELGTSVGQPVMVGGDLKMLPGVEGDCQPHVPLTS